ncbi:MAG: T9SS type A sorting domain-containing protein, partial [Bacteroidia bacterium]
NAPASPTPCTVLPIELLYFIGAMQDDNSIKLEWETANEHNSKEFILEKSSDGINYTPLSSLAAAGNSNSPVKYSYTDDSRTGDGTYYYKLRQMDKDGKESYSKVIAITIDGGGELVRFAPNPAQDFIDIVFSSKALNQDTRLEVFDTFGQRVIDEMFRPAEKLKTVDISQLPKGLYFVSMTSPAASKVVRQTLVKQ